MNYWLTLIPVISAAIGWLIHSAVVKMLFHPRKARKIGGITFQGIFPRHQQQLAYKIGKVINTEFLSFDAIEQKISNPENLKKVMPMIEAHVDDFLRNRMKKEMPVVGMFIGEKTIDNLKSMFLREIETLFPHIMKQYATGMTTELKPEQIIIQKLADFPAERLEKLLHSSMSRELSQFKIMGAVVGFIIGVIQVIITFFFF